MDGTPPSHVTADDTWEVAGRRFRSRLIVGTGRYKDLEETGRAIEASGAEIVTVAVRREGGSALLGNPGMFSWPVRSISRSKLPCGIFSEPANAILSPSV